MNRGGRPRGSAAPYRLERAGVVERAFRVLRAAGLERNRCEIEIATAAGLAPGYVDQVRRECPARYRCEQPARVPRRVDIEAYLVKLQRTFREISDSSELKRAVVAGNYRAAAKVLSRIPK